MSDNWPPADHESLDRYLFMLLALIEGGADTERAAKALSEYFADPGQDLPAEAETLLIDLFFAKAAREYLPERELS